MIKQNSKIEFNHNYLKLDVQSKISNLEKKIDKIDEERKDERHEIKMAINKIADKQTEDTKELQDLFNKTNITLQQLSMTLKHLEEAIKKN
jgi:nitrate/TMAO reductase-like tetraheme cytochrome c subunit